VVNARLGAWLIAVGVAYYFGGLGVAIIAAVLAWSLSWSDRENAFGFAPFVVRIAFTRAFVTETGIATDSQLVPPAVVPPATEYWPRRDGIRFTVLRLGLFGREGNLIYWNDHRRFSTKFEHLVSFAEFARPVDAGSLLAQGGESKVTPTLEIDEIRGGLQVSVSSSGAASERKVAVVIPHCLFDVPRLRDGKLPRRKRDAVLQRHGWTQREATDLGEYGRIPGDFEHRYLTIGISCI
jgi:hypothetical protein